VNRHPSDAKPTALPPRSGRPQPPRIVCPQRRNLAKKNLEKVEKTHHVMVISYDLMVILHGFIEIPMLMLGKIDTLTIRN